MNYFVFSSPTVILRFLIIYSVVFALTAPKVVSAAEELELSPRQFEFRLPPGAGKSDPDHQKDGLYNYSFDSYIFPSSEIITTQNSGKTKIGALLSRYLAAAKSGDLEELKKLYSEETVGELVKIISDPEVSVRFIKSLSTLEGYSPEIAVKAGERHVVVFGRAQRAGKLSRVTTPFFFVKKGDLYYLVAGRLPADIALNNLSTFMITSPIEELKITPR